ncbi:MAG: lipopolysaccharide biosynthesis protein [Oscillospiraceae bacterium]|nr:lipopolysaccharide biosynthesis protein [Oscillospiraceae bacterium]MDE5884161.1 lipopolysaccharide biosynthesis protein [Oscillospiraceae bacterium]
MAKQEERNLNITLKSEENEENEIIISFSAFFVQLKRFFIFWIVAAVIIGMLIPAGSVLFAADEHKNLTAVISFNYDGVENGYAPDGSTLDVLSSLKNPSVIEATLTSMGEPLTLLENVRQSISLTGKIPEDAANKINMYKNIYEQGNLSAGEKMLEVKYFPTQYTVTFNYAKTGLKAEKAVELFNLLLEKYHTYFLETYGFNQALGSAVTALDYTTYDYAQAVDVFSSTLTMLEEYIGNLSEDDVTRFRATSTGYSFSDLSESIDTIQEVDLDLISSYVTVNNVTKDKATQIDYYNYRIESLTRQRAIAEETLAGLNASIEQYEKNTIIIYSENQDTSEYAQASATYDDMFNRKIEAQKTVSSCTQQIDELQKRVNALKGKTAASKDKIEKVEADLAALSEKVNDLLDKTNQTANEYYETVYLANAYSILVPASTSALRTTKSVINSSMESLLVVEAVLVVLYLLLTFVLSIIYENRSKKAENTDKAESTAGSVTVESEEIHIPSVNDVETVEQEV